jgi:transposase
MAYISVRKNREGNRYVYLVEGYRVKDKVKQRILKSYGKLDALEAQEPGIIERLRSEAKAGLLTESAVKALTTTLDLSKKITADDKNYGYKILEDIYENLGINSVVLKSKKANKERLSKILKLLTFQRILNPGSKMRALSYQNMLWGDWNISENEMYKNLSLFEEIKEEVQLIVHESVKKNVGRTATLVFYDVTNYYFETDIDDEDIVDHGTGEILVKGIRKRGMSKERRPNPIVQMGLFMDTNGIPISYKLFPGNNTDTTTYIPAIEQVKKQFGIERVVVVADKGMNSKKNISLTQRNSDGWLFSQKHRGKKGADKTIQNYILSEDDWQYNENQTFAKKSMIRERQLEKGLIVKEKVVATWSQKYANREQIRRDGAVQFAEGLRQPEKYRASCKRGGKKYIEMYVTDNETGELKKMSPFLDLDYESIEFDAQFDGINILVTSEVNMSDDEIIKNYSSLSNIEDCFRVTKTEFKTRPIYVRLQEHIEAHFLTCFIALVVIRILQVKSNRMMSAGKLIEALNSAKANEVGQGYYRVQANDDMQGLNKALGIDWNLAYNKFEDIKSYAQGWFTTKI